MSQHYYADGAKHIDKHKEININLSGTLAGSEEAIAKLSKDFFADDDVEDASFEEVEDEATDDIKSQDNDTFFIDDLDLQKLKSGISVMWNKEMPQNYLAAISGKLLNNQNEWWVFYALFDKLKWYKKKPTQKEFCDFMTEWFKGEEYEHVKPCTVFDFKKLDSYIKKTRCDKWDIDAESYRGQRHKLKEFIFIWTELEREFTNKKYFIL